MNRANDNNNNNNNSSSNDGSSTRLFVCLICEHASVSINAAYVHGIVAHGGGAVNFVNLLRMRR